MRKSARLHAVCGAIVFGAAALLLDAGPAGATTLLQGIALDWRPTSSITAGNPDPATWAGRKIQIAAFGDARSNKELIGENREDERSGTVLPVTSSSDIPQWVANRFKYVLQENGLSVVDSGADLVLDGDVQRLFVDETSTYKANIVLHLRLRDAAGTVLWETNLSADQSRFGRSYKKDNYCEVLSDALINLSHSVLNSAKFRQAVVGNQ